MGFFHMLSIWREKKGVLFQHTFWKELILAPLFSLCFKKYRVVSIDYLEHNIKCNLIINTHSLEPLQLTVLKMATLYLAKFCTMNIYCQFVIHGFNYTCISQYVNIAINYSCLSKYINIGKSHFFLTPCKLEAFFCSFFQIQSFQLFFTDG